MKKFISLLLFAVCAFQIATAQLLNTPTAYPRSSTDLLPSKYYSKNEIGSALEGMATIGVYSTYYKSKDETKNTIPKLIKLDSFYQSLFSKLQVALVPQATAQADITANSTSVTLASTVNYVKVTGGSNTLTIGLRPQNSVLSVYIVNTPNSVIFPSGTHTLTETGTTTTISGTVTFSSGFYIITRTAVGYSVISQKVATVNLPNKWLIGGWYPGGASAGAPQTGTIAYNNTGKTWTLSYISTGIYRITPSNTTGITLTGPSINVNFIAPQAGSNNRYIQVVQNAAYFEIRCYNGSNTLEDVTGTFAVNWAAP